MDTVFAAMQAEYPDVTDEEFHLAIQLVINSEFANSPTRH